MWPHKAGLGVQLSYGVDGNGVIRHKNASPTPLSGDLSPRSQDSSSTSSSHKTNTDLSFPRLQINSLTLHRSPSTTPTPLVPSQASNFDLNSKIYTDLQNVYVPEEILKSYLIESRSLTSSLVYDPTIGSIFDFHDLRMKKGVKYAKVLAYVTGETGTILNVALVDSVPRNVVRGSSGSGSGSSLANARASPSHIHTPQLSTTPFQVSLSEPIKQIQFSKLEETFDYIPPHLLVRTDSSVYLLNCLRTPTSGPATGAPPAGGSDTGTTATTGPSTGIELTVIENLSTSKLAGFPFADVAFNPWDYTQFAAIDVKGNFGVWNIATNTSYVHKLTLIAKNTTAIPDAAELSNWKKITWAFGRDRLYIASRSSLVQATISEGSAAASEAADENEEESSSYRLQCNRLITSNTWSKILDFKRCSKFAFLLTSKELIWLQSGDEGQSGGGPPPVGTPSRVMSWKHFLDDSDPSLKLQVTPQGSSRFLCTLFSQATSLMFIYTLGWKDGAPYSLHDPYYIRTTKGLVQVEIQTLNRSFYHPLEEFDDREDDSGEYEELDFEAMAKSSSSVHSPELVLGLFELRTDFSLTMDILTTNPGTHLDERQSIESVAATAIPEARVAGSRSRSGTGSSSSMETTPVATPPSRVSTPPIPYTARPTAARRAFKKLSKADTRSIISKVRDKSVSDKSSAISSVQAVQDYALKLGQLSDSRSPFASLVDIAGALPPRIEDLSEFDSMVEQLSSYYKENGVTTVNFVSPSIAADPQNEKDSSDASAQASSSSDAHTSVEALSGVMSKTYSRAGISQFNSESRIKKASLLLGSSLLRTSATSLGAAASAAAAAQSATNELEKELAKTHPKLRTLLSAWEFNSSSSSSELQDGADVANYRTSQLTVPDIVPTLRLSSQLSQGDSSHRKRRSGPKRRHMTGSRLSQLSQSRAAPPPSTPIPSSQTQAPPSSQLFGGNFSPPPPSHLRRGSSSLSASHVAGSSSQLFGNSQSQSQPVKRFSSQPGSQTMKRKKKKKGGFA